LILLVSCTHVHEPVYFQNIGEGWSGNTVNTVIFRHNGILTFNNIQITAFYDQDENIMLVKRNLSNNIIETYVIEDDFNTRNAHNSISLGVDKHGFLHLVYVNHGKVLRYQKSMEPLSIEQWSQLMSMTGINEDKVTYPTFLNNPIDSTLIFVYRQGNAHRGTVYFKKYDAKNEEWIDYPNPIITGEQDSPTICPYWNHPVFDESGQLHLSFVWRKRPVNGKINNVGMHYIRSSDNGMTWYNCAGDSLFLPIIPESPTEIWSIPQLSNLINQTSMAIDANSNPHIVYYSNDTGQIPQYQHLWFDGNTWKNSTISLRKIPFNLEGKGTLQIPMSRPEVIVDKNDVVYMILRADVSHDKLMVISFLPLDYSPENAKKEILCPIPVGYAEPLIDRMRWQNDNTLTILVQFNHQPQTDKVLDYHTSPVFLGDWVFKP